MDNALLVTHLSWQGGIVLGLLFLSVFLAQFIESFPKDLIFTFAALLSPLFGIVSSKELYHASVNQAILAVLGLWVIGKASAQQGLFHTIIPWLVQVKKENLLSRIIFFLQTAFFGAFLHHRYFPLIILRWMAQRFEKSDSSVLGFPFAYLFLIGGFATVIGTSSNMIFLSLYSIAIPEVISQFFAFLPLAILPILLALLLLVIFHKAFRKIFPQFLEAPTCAVIPPDSLLIGKKTERLTVLREGKLLSDSPKLASGDLVLFGKGPVNPLFSQLIVFNSTLIRTRWKAWVTLFLFLAAIISTFFTVAIGTAFFVAGLLLLLFHPFSMKKTFREEFPLPLLLEIFSASIFFFAMRNSGLSGWVATFIDGKPPVIFLTLFFFLAQIAAHFMPRPLAFAVIFSVAFSLLSGQPAQLLIAGANIAFASAIPLFGGPKTDEIAISRGMSGSSQVGIRIALILILFVSIVIPSCLFW
jgi:hypothetical protein